MDAITYSKARAELARTMHRVCEDHEPVIVTRRSGDNVVILSLEDYDALEETAYLLRSKVNAQRLMTSVKELESGEGRERELIE